jgi:hypothetical protein
MLLNEVQKQHQQILQQSDQIQELKEESAAEMSALKAHLAELEKQLEALATPK